jgi:hypothetical protein
MRCYESLINDLRGGDHHKRLTVLGGVKHDERCLDAAIAIFELRTYLNAANARIAGLEEAIVTARADALRKVERITADRDQGMLDYCALMERYDAAIQNPTTEDVK